MIVQLVLLWCSPTMNRAARCGKNARGGGIRDEKNDASDVVDEEGVAGEK